MAYETKNASGQVELHYASLVEAMPGSCLLLRNDPTNYTILAATSAYLAQTRSTKAGIVGKRIFEVWQDIPDNSTNSLLDSLRASLAEVQRQKKPHHLPAQRYNVAGEDGKFSEIYSRISNAPVLIQGDEISYIIHAVEVVTEQAKAGEKRNEIEGSEEVDHDLRSVVLQAPIGICVMDADTLVSRIVNKSFAEIAGRPVDEIIGQRYWDTFSEARPYYEEALDQVVREGITFRANEVEVPLIRYGERENVHVTFVYEPVKDNNGVTKKVVVWVVDNTLHIKSRRKLEESEHYFRQLTDTVPVIIWITEQDGRCSYLNQHWYEYTGQTFKEAEGFGWLEATHPDDKDEVARIFTEANEGQKPFTLLYRLRSITGSYRWCKDSGSPKFSQNGAFEGFIGTVVDVHEEKIAEEKLRESEERFRSMADASPVMIWTLDENGSFSYYNSRAREFTGQSGTDLKDGRNWQVTIHPDDVEMADSVVTDALSKQIPYQMECRMMRADGEWRWLLNHGTPRFGNKGEFFGFVGSSIDITERKNAEQALKASESRFRALVNATSDVIYSLNADWTIMNPLDGRGFLSDAYAPVKNWMEKNVHPTEFETVKKNIAEAIANKSVFELEHRVVTVDGAMGWTFSRAIPILDEQGNIVEWFGAASDITARKMIEQSLKQSESRFRNVINTTPVGTAILTGPEMKIEVANNVIIKYWQRDSSVVGKPITEAIPELIGQPFPDLLSKVYKEGIAHTDNAALAYFLNAKGESVPTYFNYSYTPLRDTTGTIYGVLIMAIDVTEETLSKIRAEESESRYRALSETLEQQVRDRTRELQRSNDDLQQFAHVASHDLKEPVRKVTTFISRLEHHLEGKLDEPSSRYIEKIQSAANRMFTMIDGVLTYSTINNTTQTSQLVDLNEVIKNIETDLEVIIQKTGAKFTYNNLPAIEGAPVLLYQLFYNLANNAIKFAKAGIPPEINISSEIIKENGQASARIIFSDNGIGFETDQANMIFDTFTRLNSKDRFEGTGLGLALCKKIVERHGGRISASGVPGEGAAFTIVLHMKQNEHAI